MKNGYPPFFLFLGEYFMKQYVNRILSFILSFSFFITVFLYQSISVYALPKRLLDGTWIDVPLSEYGQELSYFFQYGVNQLGAVYNGDFEGWLKNNDTYKDLYDDNGRLAQGISIDTSTGDITYSQDLLDLIKQALRDYSEETNGLYLAPTINVHDIPLEFFSNSNRYHSLVDIVDQLGLAGVAYNGSYICNLSIIEKKGYSFVSNITSDTQFDFVSSPLYCRGFYENSSLKGPYGLGGDNAELWSYSESREFRNITDKRCSWEDGVYPLTVNSSYRVTGSLIFGYSNGKSLTNLGAYNPTSWSSYNAQYAVWSNDGRRVRVWKNEKAFIYGTEHQRTVYFSKDFYDKAPTQITVSFDEMKDTVDKLDGVLNDLLDKIDSTTDENTIEDLLQQILDEMKNQGSGNQGGNQGGGNEGGGSYDDTGLLAVLSGYFDSVLAYLGQILSAIEALVWIEADDSSLTDDQKDLFDLIDKIWDDPETGSQEMADELSGSFLDVAKGITKKFPFSIPWDIHALFSVFARAGQSQPETAMLADGYGIMPLVGEPDDGEYDYPNGDGTSTVINWDDNPHDAPYFVLPLVVESYGIEEYIEVDLKDFQTVSTLSRSLLAVLFAVFLIKFTISLMEFFRGGD